MEAPRTTNGRRQNQVEGLGDELTGAIAISKINSHPCQRGHERLFTLPPCDGMSNRFIGIFREKPHTLKSKGDLSTHPYTSQLTPLYPDDFNLQGARGIAR